MKKAQFGHDPAHANEFRYVRTCATQPPVKLEFHANSEIMVELGVYLDKQLVKRSVIRCVNLQFLDWFHLKP